MKQILLTSTFTILLMTISFSQVNVLWESRFDNNSFDDYSSDIQIDAAGNSYVVGSSYNGSQFNVVAIKYDPLGVEVWNVSHDGPASGLDEAVGLVVDSNGDVIIAGHHQISTTDFDIFAKKLDGSNGSTLWTYSHPGTNDFDQLRDIAIDGNDKVILAGGLQFAGANTQFVTISLNTGGALDWQQTYSNSTNRDFASAVTVDAANSVFVTGESYNGTNGLDYYTMKYNSAGALQWSRRFDGVAQSDRPFAITTASDGSVYVAGVSYRGLNDDDDILLLKINNAGGYVWDRLIGGSDGADDKARSVVTDPLNNIYVTGSVKNIGNGEDYYVARYRPNGDFQWDYIYQSSSNGFDEAKELRVNSNYELYVSGYSNISGSSDDYFTVRLDTVGNEIWTKRFDGPASNSDQMSAFEIDNFGNLYVTGSSTGSGTLRDYSTIKYCQLETIASADDTVCVGEFVQLNASGGMNFQWTVFDGDPITGSNFTCTNCDDPIATPAETTTYLVSSENGSGCIDYDTVIVVVNPLPGPVISANGPTSFCDGGSVDLTADFAAQYNWNTGENQQTITADTAGTYSLVVTDAMGCQNSTDIDIEIYQNPIVDGGADRFRCPGVGLTFNGTGADSLAWFPIPSYNDTIANGESFIPNATGQYELVGITPDGCIDSDTVLVTIFPNPTQIELVVGMSGNLFINIATGSTDWYQDGISLNHTGTSFFYDSIPYCEGEYSVEYTDENDCQSFDTIVVVDSMTTGSCNVGLNDYALEEVNIYPNPTLNKVYIDFDISKKRTIQVYSSTGQLVQELSINEQSTSIDLSQNERGTYFITILSERSISRARVVKQ
jgi:uncharacterized delta-60 repeat protein